MPWQSLSTPVVVVAVVDPDVVALDVREVAAVVEAVVLPVLLAELDALKLTVDDRDVLAVDEPVVLAVDEKELWGDVDTVELMVDVAELVAGQSWVRNEDRSSPSTAPLLQASEP